LAPRDTIADESDERVPIDARASLIVLAAQLQALHTMIGSLERRLIVQHRANEASKRLQVCKLALELDGR
jgi:transposase